MDGVLEITEPVFLIKSTKSLGKFHKALAAAQAEIKNPEKNQTATVKGQTRDGKAYSYEYTYADLAGGLDSIRPITAKAGIFFYQAIVENGGHLVLVTRIGCEDEWIDGEIPLGPNATVSDPQKLGALVTYLRRYELFPMLGVAGEDDAEGEALAEDPESKARAMKALADSEEAVIKKLQAALGKISTEEEYRTWLDASSSAITKLSSGGKAAIRHSTRAVVDRLKKAGKESESQG